MASGITLGESGVTRMLPLGRAGPRASATASDSDQEAAGDFYQTFFLKMNLALVDYRLKSRDFRYSIEYCSELCYQIRDVLNSNRSFSARLSSTPRSLSRKLKNKCTVRCLYCFGSACHR